MNLLEIIKEYLYLKNTPGQDAEAWLERMAHDNDWPKGNKHTQSMLNHIRGCWVDCKAKAIEEAQNLLALYEVSYTKFDLVIVSETRDPAGDSGLVDTRYHVRATHKDADYGWVCYDVSVLLNARGEVANPELQWVQVVDPNG